MRGRKRNTNFGVAAWKEQYKAAVEEGEARHLTAGTTNPKSRCSRRLIVNDATFEALHQTMSENPAGILVIRDELTGWWSTLGPRGPGR